MKKLQRRSKADSEQMLFKSAKNILDLPGFRQLNSQCKENLQHRFQELIDRPKGGTKSTGKYLDELEFKVKHVDRQSTNRVDVPVNKRSIARKINKEHEVARLYFKENLTSSVIAK